MDLILSGIIVAANYEAGPTREMIHHLKYSGFTELSDLLGELIVQRLIIESSFFYHPELVSGSRLPRSSTSLRARNDRERDFKNYLLVPVPLHISKFVERGFNQSELIARYVSNRTNIPCNFALNRIRYTESQVGLTGSERRSNLEGAFSCVDNELIKNKTILLVDDVTTTYSTLNQCAKELKSAGAKKVFGLVVARG